MLSDLNEVEKFAIEATEVLRKQPQTVEEIGESNKRHKEYKEQMDLKRGLMDMSEGLFINVLMQTFNFSDIPPLSPVILLLR